MNTSAVIPFRFGSQDFRALTVDGEPWFVAKDVCDVLDLENVTKAVYGLDEDELALLKVRSGGQEREMNCVSESGLYTLIIRSNKPQAKPFRKWVTGEVLPSIRKTGGYAMPHSGKRADIFHHRRPVSRTGLDIRFTCDLTRVISKRRANDLAVLQRLTGIELMDLAGSDDDPIGHHSRAELHALLDRFAEVHLIRHTGATCTFKALYQRFLGWYGQQGLDMGYVPSLKAVSSWLDAQDLPRRKPSGISTVYGCLLVDEVAA